MTDAFDTAVGAILQQCINGQWHPIVFFFKKPKLAETRYSTFDRELLAIYVPSSNILLKVVNSMSLQITSH